MLDKECNEDIHRVLIGNPKDPTSEIKMLPSERMSIAIANGMHRYLEVPPKKDSDITSTITDII